MNRSAVLLLVGALGLSTAAAAQDRGSVEDQLACTPDVYRLCSQNIPDEDAIVACLRQRRAELSAGCKAVFGRKPTPKAKGADQDDD